MIRHRYYGRYDAPGLPAYRLLVGVVLGLGVAGVLGLWMLFGSVMA